ncbi:MAG TPA: bifunctional phosphoglucose/phosphomannose isomerase [Acidobacteriota bacterium]|nr:bifunctional phosphoglucose/phosphomannose isomerase [Acidobacteriota bacterium]
MSKTEILNDLKKMKEVDRNDMLSFCVKAPEHYEKAARLAKVISINYPKPKTIIIAGMGGSAIGGELVKDWARDKIAVPVEVCREYSLPAYADKSTMVAVVSYSGETEETLSVFLDAIKRKCMMFGISSSGALQEFAEKLSVPHLLVPSGMAPRASLPYLFMPLPVLLEKAGFVSNVTSEISDIVKSLKQISDTNSPEKPLDRNFAKKLASNISGTIPVVYGFEIYNAVAHRLKTQFNENSKVPAKWECFSELDHNEIVGWEAANRLARHFSAIFIRDDSESEAMRTRIEITQELMRKKFSRIYEIKSIGKSQLAKMSSVICTGDFTSVYLAIMRGIDPTPVKSIASLKEKLKRSGTKEKIINELQKIARK